MISSYLVCQHSVVIEAYGTATVYIAFKAAYKVAATGESTSTTTYEITTGKAKRQGPELNFSQLQGQWLKQLRTRVKNKTGCK